MRVATSACRPVLGRGIAAVTAAIALSASCGLIKGDLGTLNFQLPAKNFSFDTAGGMWKAPPGTFPPVACGPGQLVTDCCHPPAPAPAPDCTATPLVCENSVCVLAFPVTVIQKIDLRAEVPALMNIGNQSLADVSIKQIHYTIASTMNAELPPIQIYIAPQTATSADDPAAKKFGTVPATPAMATRTGDVTLDPEGQALFTQYAHQLGTPFNLISTTTMVVAPGDPVPTGKVDAVVTGTVSAKLSL
jgi:hypothetical protein